MLKVVDVSPSNEMPIARDLARSIRAAWPDLESHPQDRVTIVVGVEMFREIDLIVAIHLAEPRPLPPVLRRDGSRSPVSSVRAAVLTIEVKQLEALRFRCRGTEIFADYRDGATHVRSVNVQAKEAALSLHHWWSRYGMEQPYVFALSWLTEVDETQLAGVNPWVVGHGVGWFGLLDAAAQQSRSLSDPQTPAFGAAIDTMVEVLARNRSLSPRDRARTNAICNDVLSNDVVGELAASIGSKLVRIAGHGGSGKTTTLVLLAKRLAVDGGERVLILTFHKTLRNDIAHLVSSTVDVPGIAGKKIVVETVTEFFIAALLALGVELPRSDVGAIDFTRLSTVLDETRAMLVDDDVTGDAALLKRREPKRFAYDYVMVDEAQDWEDAERDFLFAFYGCENVAIADGLDQLIRRPDPCDWLAGIPKTERVTKKLGRSLRMSRNLAEFANHVARASGLLDWRLSPLAELPGGRIVVAVGGEVDAVALHAAVATIAHAGAASLVDTLVCLPPRETAFVARLEASGVRVWDGTQPIMRDTPPPDVDCWRVVRYDSCRGLEGWVTVADGLDLLIESKLRHPPPGLAEPETWQRAAQKWLMMAVTRAVNTLVITIRDPRSPLVTLLREASDAMPKGTVEWTTGENLAAVLASNDDA